MLTLFQIIELFILTSIGDSAYDCVILSTPENQ